MEPVFPVIVFGRQAKDLLYVVEDIGELQSTSLLGLFTSKPSKEVFFDSRGQIWHRTITARNKRYGVLMKLLAYTVYNPSNVSISNKWLLQGEYSLLELKQRVVAAIEMDDDVLTQFVDAEELIRLAENVTSFKELVVVLMNPLHDNYEYPS